MIMKYVGWVFFVYGAFITIAGLITFVDISLNEQKSLVSKMHGWAAITAHVLLMGVGAYIIKNFTPKKD